THSSSYVLRGEAAGQGQTAQAMSRQGRGTLPGKSLARSSVSSSLVRVKEKVVSRELLPVWQRLIRRHPQGLDGHAGPSSQVSYRHVTLELDTGQNESLVQSRDQTSFW